VFTVFTHKLQSARACDLNFIVKGERLLKASSSHVYWKSGIISEMLLDRDVTTGH